jgi:hypothetical protein
MSRLVLVRVGEPESSWSICKEFGIWASPENHEQVVRNLFMEGYSVYILFAGTGDQPLIVTHVTNVRERRRDDTLIQDRNEIGVLKTIITFDINNCVDLRNQLINSYQVALDYVRYKRGSQILIPASYSVSILRLISLSQTNTDPANNFANKASQLRAKIDLEFCYYYVRYRYALTQVLTQAANAAIDRNSPTYVTLKTNTEKINQKLNQIIQILQSLANNRLATLSTYYGTTTGVNRVNSDLESIKTSLNRDALALKNSKMEANVKNAMMDYTIEKNNSSRNLLAIYGFLNIVAVGTIFYLYKNTAD